MIVTVAPDITPPLWSVTVPRMRPKLPCENNETENSNTPTIAPSTHTPCLAREIFNAEFIAPPIRNRSSTSWNGRTLKTTYLEKGLRLNLGKGRPEQAPGFVRLISISQKQSQQRCRWINRGSLQLWSIKRGLLQILTPSFAFLKG